MSRLKLISLTLLLLVPSLGAFYWFAARTFAEDKRLFVMDLNHTLLEAATGKVKLGIQSRLDDLQILVPRILDANPELPVKTDFFAGLSPRLKEELIAVTFFRPAEGTFDGFRQYRNQRALRRRGVTKEALATVYREHRLPLPEFAADRRLRLLNRSIRFQGSRGPVDFTVLTLLLDGSFLKTAPPGTFLAVDLSQEFLRGIVAETEVAEVFFLFGDGRLLTHADPRLTVDHAAAPFSHPITRNLVPGMRNARELSVGGEWYFVSAMETGFPDLFAVAQTRKSDAFLALRTLMEKGVLLALLAASLALALTLMFALARRGRRGTVVARPEAPSDSLETGSAIAPDSSTEDATGSEASPPGEDIVSPALFRTEEAEAYAHFPDGDHPRVLAGAWAGEGRLLFYCGEVRPQDLPRKLMEEARGIVEASLREMPADLGTGDRLTAISASLHGHFRGRLFMTFTLGVLDLETGRLEIASAAHPAPLCLRGKTADKAERKLEALIARGERLGAKKETGFPSVLYQLGPGDRIAVFTQGTLDAKDASGEPWGTEGLATALADGADREGDTAMAILARALSARTDGKLPKGDRALLLVHWKRAAAGERAEDFYELGAEEAGTREAWLYARVAEPEPEEGELTQLHAESGEVERSRNNRKAA